MKKLLILLAFASITAGASLALAGSTPGTGINGSEHDMNYAGIVANDGTSYTGDVFQRSCAFCHTPHNATNSATTDITAPLWNHAQSTVTLPSYVWASPLNTGITFATDPLIGPSRLCMGCHDGITAPDSHGSAGGSIGSKGMTASYPNVIGGTAKRYITDLTVTHPIGFLYSAALTARNNTPNTPTKGTGDGNQLVPSNSGFIAPGQLVGQANNTNFNTNSRTSLTSYSTKTIADVLYGGSAVSGATIAFGDGYVTCASCHDVHNSVNVSPDASTIAAGHSYNYFLYAQEEGSAICLSCHIK